MKNNPRCCDYCPEPMVDKFRTSEGDEYAYCNDHFDDAYHDYTSKLRGVWKRLDEEIKEREQ